MRNLKQKEITNLFKEVNTIREIIGEKGLNNIISKAYHEAKDYHIYEQSLYVRVKIHRNYQALKKVLKKENNYEI